MANFAGKRSPNEKKTSAGAISSNLPADVVGSAPALRKMITIGNDYREGLRRGKSAEIASAAAKVAYDTYCRVLEDELNSLYENVKKDFSNYYRWTNGDDEAKFTAKLKPTKGRHVLDVNFYERGLFPPSAYRSSMPSASKRLELYATRTESWLHYA